MQNKLKILQIGSSDWSKELAIFPNQYYLLHARVIEQTAKTDFGTTFKIKVISADHQKVNGKMLCFFPSKISTNIIKAIEPNNELVLIAECKPINPRNDWRSMRGCGVLQ